MIKNFYAKLLSSKSSSILIFVFGILAQIITYLPLIFLMLNNHSNGQISPIFFVLTGLWFFIPLISILAISVSITQISRKEKSASTVTGLVLNVIWLILFLCLVFMLFTDRLLV